MRKFNFYSIVALVGAMVLSMSSCTKDLEDDVDALKKEVAANKDAIAALDKAIKAGSRITAVTPVATGFEMTFSDGSKITVLHGQNGANGSNGSNGNDGINGTDGFTPIIGIDSENYWTVVATKGGEPERILVGGLPVKAVGTANVEVKGGYLWIDGVITELGGLPTFVLDEANGVAHITMFDADGVEKNFTVLLDGALAGVNSMVRSVVAPLSMIAIDLTYGVAENTFVGGPFAGKVTKDKVYKSGGILPVIINPSNATITKDQITIENAKGVKLPIEVSSVVKGFEGEMERVSPITRAAATNGLWSINLAITPEILESESEEFLNYAVKVAKSETEAVYSGYEYQIYINPAMELSAITAKSFGRSITTTEILFAGAEKEVLTGTTESLYVVDPADILMSRVDFKNESDKVAYGKYIECTATGVKMKKDDEATHLALNTKKIDFVYTVVDYNGASVAYPNGVYTAANEIVVGITFNSTFGQDEYALSAVNHTLTIDLPETTGVDETIKLADLDELYNQLGAAKEALWRENATALTVNVVDKDNAVAAGVTAKVVDKDGNVVALGSAFPKNIQFTFDPTVALPGKYTAEFTYTDKRGTTAKTFVVKVPVTITNPTMETAVKFRVPTYFTGDNVTVYGTTNGGNVAQATNPASIDLTALYNILTPNIAFEIIPIEGVTTTLTGNVLTIDGDMMYNNFRVKVIYKYFGNVNNTNVLFDEINVQAKSEVKEGGVIPVAPAKALEVVAGDKTTKVDISLCYVAKDYRTNDLKAFGDVANKDGRAKVVTVKRDLTDGNYSLVTEPVYDTTTKAWVVTASDKLIDSASVDVNLIVEIEDLFGQKLVKTIPVKVKKTK